MSSSLPAPLRHRRVPRSPLRQRIDVEQGKVQLGVTREPNRSVVGPEKENGFSGAGPDGRRAPERLVHDLGLSSVKVLESAVIPAARQLPVAERPIVYFDGVRHETPFSVRRALSGKRVMLIGVTGFIGKVWLVNTLMELPEIGRIYLLIRRQKHRRHRHVVPHAVEEQHADHAAHAAHAAAAPSGQ